MKSLPALTAGVCLVLALSTVHAWSQIPAGTPEDRAYQMIVNESNADAKIRLVHDYETMFPESKFLPEVLVMTLDAYQQKNDRAKIAEVGEKVIKLAPENYTALMAVSRAYAMDRKNLSLAVQYAERSVSAIEKLKGQSPPPTFTDEQWKQFIESNLDVARSLVGYAKSIRP